MKKIIEKYELKELFFGIVLSAVIVLLLLFIIFKISPDTAYFSYDAENVTSITDVNAESLSGTIQFGSKNRAAIFILSDFEEINFSVWDFVSDYNTRKAIIAGNEYNIDDIESVKLIPHQYSHYTTPEGEEITLESQVRFQSVDTPVFFYVQSQKLDDSANHAVHISSISDTLSITFNNGFYGYFKTKENKGNYDHDGGFYISDEETEEVIWLEPPNPVEDIQFDECQGIIIFKNGQELDLGQVYTSDSFGISRKCTSINIKDKVTLKTNARADGIPYYSIHDMYINNITDIQTNGSGKLDFSYARTPNEYMLANQMFSISNPNNIVYMKISEYDYEKTKGDNNNALYLNGTVKEKAILSENNLFPDMKSWFRENVYLAPLAFLTTILGAFAIKPKENKKSNKNDKLEHEILENLNKYLKKLNKQDVTNNGVGEMSRCMVESSLPDED